MSAELISSSPKPTPFSDAFHSTAYKTLLNGLQSETMDRAVKAKRLEEMLPLMWDEDILPLAYLLKDRYPDVARSWIEACAKLQTLQNKGVYLLACWSRMYFS